MSKKRKNKYPGMTYDEQLISEFVVAHSTGIASYYMECVARMTGIPSNEIQLDYDDMGHYLSVKQCRAYFTNLFLDIAAVDRDDTPLKFDLKLHDDDYLAVKIARIIKIRAEVFSGLIKNALNKGNADSMKQYLKDYYETHKSEIDRISIGPPISEDEFKKLSKKQVTEN